MRMPPANSNDAPTLLASGLSLGLLVSVAIGAVIPRPDDSRLSQEVVVGPAAEAPTSPRAGYDASREAMRRMLEEQGRRAELRARIQRETGLTPEELATRR